MMLILTAALPLVRQEPLLPPSARRLAYPLPLGKWRARLLVLLAALRLGLGALGLQGLLLRLRHRRPCGQHLGPLSLLEPLELLQALLPLLLRERRIAPSGYHRRPAV